MSDSPVQIIQWDALMSEELHRICVSKQQYSHHSAQAWTSVSGPSGPSGPSQYLLGMYYLPEDTLG